MINKPRWCSNPCPRPLWALLAATLLLGCDNNPKTSTEPAVQDVVVAERAEDEPRDRAPLGAEQEKEIRGLIEQLVFVVDEAKKAPALRPDDEEKMEEEIDEQVDQQADAQVEAQLEEHNKRYEDCQKAFQRLSEWKEIAFPFLIEHLHDDRPSIPFRNHFGDWTVGAACYWNIYFQLQDRPDDYSSYGYSRRGRDGGDYPQPYWTGAPFDDAGGPARWDSGALVKWLEANKTLSYTEKQIKCLRWLLEKEKAIGASDADSYFENILPLEIRIAERRREAGENVQAELDRLRMIRDKKLVAEIPRELLPDE